MERTSAEILKNVSWSKLIPYVEAIETEVGRTLVSYLVDEYYRTLSKAVSVDSTTEDRIRHSVVSDMLKFWTMKVLEYEKSIKQQTDRRK